MDATKIDAAFYNELITADHGLGRLYSLPLRHADVYAVSRSRSAEEPPIGGHTRTCCRCALLALSGHRLVRCTCLLFDPKRTRHLH